MLYLFVDTYPTRPQCAAVAPALLATAGALEALEEKEAVSQGRRTTHNRRQHLHMYCTPSRNSMLLAFSSSIHGSHCMSRTCDSTLVLGILVQRQCKNSSIIDVVIIYTKYINSSIAP